MPGLYDAMAGRTWLGRGCAPLVAWHRERAEWVMEREIPKNVMAWWVKEWKG